MIRNLLYLLWQAWHMLTTSQVEIDETGDRWNLL